MDPEAAQPAKAAPQKRFLWWAVPLAAVLGMAAAALVWKLTN
jgi:hypothetical protein